MSRRKWKMRIRHILEAIDRVFLYVQDMDEKTFCDDTRTLDAVIRNFQVIGEAVKLVPHRVQARHPEIPWSLMRGMRNVLVHDYNRVKIPILWDTLHRDLSPLVPLLRTILEEDPGE